MEPDGEGAQAGGRLLAPNAEQESEKQKKSTEVAAVAGGAPAAVRTTGLERWNAVRREWRARTGEQLERPPAPSHTDADSIAMLHLIFSGKDCKGTSEQGGLPLPTVVDCLVNLWEVDGL